MSVWSDHVSAHTEYKHCAYRLLLRCLHFGLSGSHGDVLDRRHHARQLLCDTTTSLFVQAPDSRHLLHDQFWTETTCDVIVLVLVGMYPVHTTFLVGPKVTHGTHKQDICSPENLSIVQRSRTDR